MEIVVVIDDKMLEEPVKKYVAQAVSEIVRQKAAEYVNRYSHQIEHAISVYLSKRLTDKELKGFIDVKIAELVESKLREEGM